MPYPITATCNFNCVFCDKTWSAQTTAPVDEVLADAPMSELSGLRAVLGGGEPTLHPQLPQILSGLKAQGVRRLSMRSNGAWASRVGPIQFLKAKGLTEVTLLFISDDPEEFDRLARKTGAYDAVRKAVENFAAVGMKVSVRVPVLKPTLHRLPDILQAIPTLIPAAKRIDLVLLDQPDPDYAVRWEALNAQLPFGSKHPWPTVPKLYLDPGYGIPMCWAKGLENWEVSPDHPTAQKNYAKPCDGCFMQHVCPGISAGYVAAFGDDVAVPYQIDFESVTRNNPHKHHAFEAQQGVTYEVGDEEQAEASIAALRLRVGHKCNRRCDFCFIPHHEKSVQDYDIDASIEAAVQEGVRTLVMTGGEPTLQPDLPRYIQAAKDGGVRRIILQTNGIKLADPEFTADLAAKGLTHVVVSLHSHRDDILREITRLPNTMGRILQGIENLHNAGLQMSVTHVITPKIYRTMPEFVRFMVEQSYVRRFCFIFATPMAWPMATKELVVRYADAAPYLMEALDYCIDNGVVVDGMAYKCGAPHCVVKGEPKYLLDAVEIPDNNRTDDWVRVPACSKCVLRNQCYGVRRLYVWLYGADEFEPVLDPAKAVGTVRTAAPSGPVETPPEMRAATQLVERIGRDIGLEPAVLRRLFAPAEQLEFTLPTAEGGTVRATRTRYSRPGRPTMGGVEFTPRAHDGAARTTAFLETIRAAALGVEVAGAHGMIECGPQNDPTALVINYVRAVQDQPQAIMDYLTPHTSSPWPLFEGTVDDEMRTEPTPRVGVLRRTPRGPLASLRMTSVDTAVAASQWAMQDHSGVIRYSVYGFGRAGQRFAALMDRAVFANGNRAAIVACADSQSANLESKGMEFEKLVAFKQRHGRLPSTYRGNAEPVDALLMPCDVLLLSNRGRALTPSLVARLDTKVVVDMTNGVSPDLERALCDRGIRVIPALVATAGPILLAELERRGQLTDAASARAFLRSRTHDVLDALAADQERTPTAALVALGLAALARELEAPPATSEPAARI